MTSRTRYASGTRIGHFRIQEAIGVGRMGEVYRAHDESLNRDVALKFPAPELIQDETVRARFAREARVLASLHHPAIPAIYEFGSEGGDDFIAMEIVPGETLEDRIRGGALREPDLVDLGVQLADGLAAAHGAGVLHRDLKPANLMITPKGEVRILDFGLARPIHREAGTALTATDTVPGTLPYLAPELLTGGEPSERSDLYGVGLVLYEAATGSLPFPGLKGAALWNAITRVPVGPARERNPGLSRALSDLIGRLLEKQPEKRPESARALAARLRTLGRRKSTGSLRRVALVAGTLGVAALLFVLGRVIPRDLPGGAPESWAVLRMSCDSSDPGVAFYSDGLAAGLVEELSGVAALRVTAWESSRGFCPDRTPLPDIAARLQVQRLVTGDVQIARGRLRVHAHIVDPAANRTVWSRSFNSDTSQYLALERSLRREVAREIRREVPSAGAPPPSSGSTESAVARRAYQRARYHWERRPDELPLAIRYFERAIAADSSYALAYAGLADAWAEVGLHALKPPAEARGPALAAARRAVALDENLSEAHFSLAHILHNYEWDWQGAEADYRRAIELNPSNAAAHHGYAHLLAQLGRIPEARREIREALELDPNNVSSSMAAGVIEYYARDFPASLTAVADAAELDSTNVLLHRLRAAVLDRMGRPAEAVAELARAAELQGQAAFAAGLRQAYAKGGIDGALQLMIVGLRARRDAGAYEPAEHVAELYSRLGRVNEALDWLETAYRERDTELNRLAEDPLFDPLRGSPRFRSLLQRVGFAPAG